MSNKKKTTNEFIEESKKVHGDKYDYSLVDYKNNKTNVTIICPIHGEFETPPHVHLRGSNCRKCSKNIGLASRTCKECNTEKGITEYRHGCRTCKVCENKKQVEYRKNNKNKVREIKKEWRKKNKDAENDRTKRWKNNLTEQQKEEQRIKRNEYLRNKRKTDPKFRMKEAMHKMLKRTIALKDGKTSTLLGYSAIQLKEHLEKQFTDGMSWDNYGEWHIDHIIPIKYFNVNTPPDIVNALTNLQPLWSTTREINGVIYEGNINKGDRY